MPKAFKSCPKCKKSPNLVTLDETHMLKVVGPNPSTVYWMDIFSKIKMVRFVRKDENKWKRGRGLAHFKKLLTNSYLNLVNFKYLRWVLGTTSFAFLIVFSIYCKSKNYCKMSKTGLKYMHNSAVGCSANYATASALQN